MTQSSYRCEEQEMLFLIENDHVIVTCDVQSLHVIVTVDREIFGVKIFSLFALATKFVQKHEN